ncbi:asparaginase [Lachnospiraceae bacterium C7]|nr:asparaginase [Lachnospiraceae bacterium C7]
MNNLLNNKDEKKKILLIATGGTIASKQTATGLTPQITKDELLDYIPVVRGFCDVDSVQVFNLDSSNVNPKHWEIITKCVQENYDNYDGFVITHGTDTMAYTAAALSYMIQNSNKPIVITGSQKPINLDITDAKSNLTNSFLYAADSKSQGVQIVFDGKVIAGTRAKKVRSKSYNAFSSIDFPYLATIQGNNILRYIAMVPFEEKVKFYLKLNPNVFLLKLIPGMKPEILELIFEKYDAIVVESFGVGGIPKPLQGMFYEEYKKYPNKTIVMCTQVAHEGSDMSVYQVGNEMKSICNFLESYDMTLESVIAKTMWMLGNSEALDGSVEQNFYKKINYDIIFEK